MTFYNCHFLHRLVSREKDDSVEEVRRDHVEEYDAELVYELGAFHAASRIPDTAVKWDLGRDYVTSDVDDFLPSDLPLHARGEVDDFVLCVSKNNKIINDFTNLKMF